MNAIIPQFVDHRKTTFCGLRNYGAIGHEFVMAKEEPQYDDIGARLAKIRQTFSDMNQKQWSERHGFAVTQYNNWEKGTRRIPLESAEKLCNLYGLTLDFVYRGRRDGLSEKASNSL